MSELEDQIRALQEIREKKKEILDQESQARERIIQLAGTDKYMSVGDITLDVSSKDRLKIIDPESVPNFLKSNLPDQQRINEYFHETGHVPPGVELRPVTFVKVKPSEAMDPKEPEKRSCSYCGSWGSHLNLNLNRDENRLEWICESCAHICDNCGDELQNFEETGGTRQVQYLGFRNPRSDPVFIKQENDLKEKLDPGGRLRHILERDFFILCESCYSRAWSNGSEIRL